MISFMKEPWKSEQIVKLLNPIIKEWFFSKFKDFSEPQKYAIGPIHNGENILVSAVTGSGKTLTGFLTVLNELITLSDNDLLENKVYCIYISPLKALNNDIHFNLITPLKEMEELSKKNFNIKVSVRTGDTTATEKQKMLKTVPHIIITTPESLAIMLTSYKFRELLRDVRYVIVDEVHALADNKRGVHLSLSLERLNLLTNKEYVRIGLGATSEPLEEIAGFLVGSGRDCKIANVDLSKKMDIKVLSPVPDLINVNARTLQHKLYTLIDNLIQEHRTTLIFTNTRSATERVIHHLKEKFPKNYTENIGAHHGSLSKSHRIELEKRMREGKLKVVVSSTSLELGVDIGYIDLVIMLGSPKSVARAVQRCLPYESEILMEDGSYLPIGDIVEKQIPLKVISFDKNKGYVVNKIVKYHKYEDENLINIKLKCGEEIKCTKEHEILTKDGWKKAINLTKHDKIAEVNENIHFNNNPVYIYELLPKDKIYVENKDNFYQKIIDRFNKQNMSNVKSFSISNDVPYSRLIDCRRLRGRRKSIRLDYFLKACELNGLNKEDYLPYLTNLKTKNNFRLKVPLELNEDLMWLTGIMATDGCIVKHNTASPYYHIKIGNKSKKLIMEAKRIINSLGFKGHLYKRKQDNCLTLECGSNLLSYLFINLGLKYKNKTIDVEVGNVIYKLNDKLIHAYLEGIFEGDGNFGYKTNNIRIFSASKKFIYGLHRLFRRLGYHNTIIKQESKTSKLIKKIRYKDIYCLTITRKNDVKRFLTLAPKIGEKAIKSYNSIKDKKFLKNNLKQFEDKIYWSDINSIKKDKKDQFVYNLTLKNNSNNFIVGNAIVHNCGRAGHALHEIIKGRIIVLDRDDLVECAIMLKDVLERKIDRIHIPENALDVLAQQVNGIAISDQMKISDVYKTVKKSYCYRNLDYKEFLEVINYLAGNYITLEDRNIYAKIWYDEETGMIGKRGKMGRVIYMTNIGTIPDESFIQVKINEQIIGSLDEGFLERLKRGDIFVLGGNTYEFLFARGQVAQVRNAIGKQPTVPSWFSEMLPLSFDLASDIGKFRRLMEEKFRNKRSKEDILKFINEYLYVDENSANAIYEYFREQYLFMQEIPSDKKLIVERYNEEGKKYFIFHTIYGRRVNDVLSRVVGYAIGRIQHRDVEIGISDNGFYVASIKDIQVLRAFKLIKSKEIYDVAKKAIEKSEILKRRFRHCATRSLMILRQYKGVTKRVGRQQVSSMILLSAVRRIDENFCILKEARREVLEDLMDIDNAKMIIGKIENDEIKIKEIETSSPSPFAFNLASQGYSDVLKIEDKIEFLRRMHNRVLNKIGDKVPKEEKEFDYKDVWDKAEEKKEEERDEKVDELKAMAYNLKHVPFRVKEEIVELVVNNKELSDDTIEGLKKWKEDINKNWPKELRKVVFEKVKV